MPINNIEAAVDKLDAVGLIRKDKVRGDWYTIYCPFHSGGQERRPSCGILINEQVRNGVVYQPGLLHCFTCGASYSLPNAVTEILKNRSISMTGLDWLTENIPGFTKNEIGIEPLVPNEVMSGIMSKYATESLRMRINGAPKYVSEEELASYRFTVPYMYERKLTDDVINRYDVGYDANYIPPGRTKALPCVTFPVRDHTGKALFICRRSIQGKFFNYPTDVVKPVYGLYELPRCAKSVIICESIFNCLTCVAYGYSAVALLGTGTPYQIKQLQRLGAREFIICLDGDDAGHKGTAKLKKALQGIAFVWTMHVPDGEDVNSITREQFEEVYAARE